MKKRIMYLCFTVLLLSVCVNKVNAAKYKYWCYYKDAIISSEISGMYTSSFATEQANGGFFGSNKSKEKDMANTYIEMKVTEDYKATFGFYDSTNKSSFEEIYFKNSDVWGDGKLVFSEDSGVQLDESDFYAGCPNYLDRLRLKDTSSSDGFTITFLYDSLKYKSTKTYKNMYVNNMIDVDWWAPYATMNEPCYNRETSYYTVYYMGFPVKYKTEDSSATSNDTNASKIQFCSLVDKVTIEDKTVEPSKADDPGNDDIVCKYGGYTSQNGGEAEVQFSFYKSTGEFVPGSGKCAFANDAVKPEPDFNLTKQGDNYVCPKAVYDCSKENEGETFSNQKCSGEGEVYNLVTSVKSKDSDVSGCDMFKNLGKYITGAYTLIRYLIPTLIVILSTADFAGVIFSGEADKMEKAKNKFIIRLILGVVALLIPFLLEVLLRFAGIIESKQSLADVACNLFG